MAFSFALFAVDLSHDLTRTSEAALRKFRHWDWYPGWVMVKSACNPVGQSGALAYELVAVVHQQLEVLGEPPGATGGRSYSRAVIRASPSAP